LRGRATLVRLSNGEWRVQRLRLARVVSEQGDLDAVVELELSSTRKTCALTVATLM
jgi:hypothetical protein